jgi:hypothetical protein
MPVSMTPSKRAYKAGDSVKIYPAKLGGIPNLSATPFEGVIAQVSARGTYHIQLKDGRVWSGVHDERMRPNPESATESTPRQESQQPASASTSPKSIWSNVSEEPTTMSLAPTVTHDLRSQAPSLSFKDAMTQRRTIQKPQAKSARPSRSAHTMTLSLESIREEFNAKLSIMGTFMRDTVVDSLRNENLRLREAYDHLVSENKELRAMHHDSAERIEELNAEVMRLNPDHNTWLLELASYRQRINEAAAKVEALEAENAFLQKGNPGASDRSEPLESLSDMITSYSL